MNKIIIAGTGRFVKKMEDSENRSFDLFSMVENSPILVFVQQSIIIHYSIGVYSGNDFAHNDRFDDLGANFISVIMTDSKLEEFSIMENSQSKRHR